MGELEDLYMDPTKIYVFTTMEAEGERQDPVKLALAAPAPPRSHKSLLTVSKRYFQCGAFC